MNEFIVYDSEDRPNYAIVRKGCLYGWFHSIEICFTYTYTGFDDAEPWIKAQWFPAEFFEWRDYD